MVKVLERHGELTMTDEVKSAVVADEPSDDRSVFAVGPP